MYRSTATFACCHITPADLRFSRTDSARIEVNCEQLSIHGDLMDCCCLGTQQPASNTNGDVVVAGLPDDHQAQERPEMRMNRAVLLDVFFASAASGIGTIGFVWATVVLLGGFETNLNQVDFWFITALSFFQAIRIFGGDWNADQKDPFRDTTRCSFSA